MLGNLINMSGYSSKVKAVNHLSAQNIQVYLNKRMILKGVSLSIKQGEIVTIIGPNGAGKSTLLRTISGFIKPSGGTIYFGESDIAMLPTHKRSQIGILHFMQGGKVFSSLTVKENLELGAFDFPNSKDEFVSILNTFPNLQNLLNRRAGLLSGGERQSLALAMMLVKRPQLLLLDEPSAGLAPKLAQEIINQVREINKLFGTTIILVEQNIRNALKIADRAVVMVNGKIASETHQPTLWSANGQLEHLFLGHDERFSTELTLNQNLELGVQTDFNLSKKY